VFGNCDNRWQRVLSCDTLIESHLQEIPGAWYISEITFVLRILWPGLNHIICSSCCSVLVYLGVTVFWTQGLINTSDTKGVGCVAKEKCVRERGAVRLPCYVQSLWRWWLQCIPKAQTIQFG
jgi:hypothetical protein